MNEEQVEDRVPTEGDEDNSPHINRINSMRNESIVNNNDPNHQKGEQYMNSQQSQ